MNADRDHSEQPRALMAHRLAEQGHKIDPLAALHDALVFSSNDWGAARDFAFIYGIVVGWDGDDPEDDDDAMSELANKWGWSADGVQRLRALHEAFDALLPASERLADAGTTQSAPEPSQAATEAQGDDERVRRYAEAIYAADQARNPEIPFGFELNEWGKEARAVMAVADAEQAELRAEVERVWRYFETDAAALRERAEAAEAKVGDLEMSLAVESAKRAAAEAKVARVEALHSKWATARNISDGRPNPVLIGISAMLRAALDGDA